MHKAYEKLYTSPKRYFLVTGGRGSLKTSNVMEFAIKLTFEKGHGILYTRYTLSSASTSIIPELETVLSRLGLSSYFVTVGNRVENISNGSFIVFSGIKTGSKTQTAKLKSISGITTWIMEEGEEFQSEKDFDTIDDSVRSINKQNRIIWVQNSTTRDHFIYTRFVEKTNRTINVEGFDVTVSTHPEVEHIHTTYHLGLQYLAESWIRKAAYYYEKIAGLSKEDRQKSHYYYNYIGGFQDIQEGVIYANWTEGEFDHKLPFCYVVDYGYFPDPLAILKIAINERSKKIYIEEKAYLTEVNDVSAVFDRIGIRRRADLIVCDTNEPRTTANLAKAGWNIQPARKNTIIDDIREINQYEIIVTPESSNFKFEIKNYTWNDKKASIPIGEYNHLMDCMRYGFVRLTLKQAGVRIG